MISAVICAAGLSSRMGRKKEFLKLNDKPVTVLGSAVAAFSSVPSVEIIVIAIPPNSEEAARAALSPELTGSKSNPKIFFVNGGQTRQASVFNALLFLNQYDPHYVLIHDGARPWVSPSLIESIIKAAEKYGAVIPALSLLETPKEFTAPFENVQPRDGAPIFIKTHLKRANTGAAQTPQGFKFAEILLAHKKAAQQPCEFTDDAEVYGMFCGDVAVIPGAPENCKITFPQDMETGSGQ